MGTDILQLFERIRSGEREGLAKGITLIESELPTDSSKAQQLLRKAIPFSHSSVTIGITGVPGVGKSTMLNNLGMKFIEAGHRVAVLAIDPSSARSHGSILGDKTRMDDLSQHEKAFIRPSPTSGILGGVSRRTREAAILCAAAGYDHIFIETVGVGQNELEIDDLADITILLLLTGAGDELQGIKRGIMEAADVMAINKADGNNEKAGKRTAMELRNALTIMPPRDSGKRAQVLTCSAIEDFGVQELMEHTLSLFEELRKQGVIAKRRQRRMQDWMNQRVRDSLLGQLNIPTVQEQLLNAEQMIASGQQDPIAAAESVLKFMRTNFGTQTEAPE